MNADSPIGLFDSGVGGLTVANAIKYILPGEKMIYYGDTAHLPYGDKSKTAIINYSLKITDFLLSRSCKVILIACNTASSNAYEEIKTHVAGRALLMNVIDPVIEHVVNELKSLNVGVIGTKATINSGAYLHGIKTRNSKINVVSMSAPLLVPMIEGGFISDEVSNTIIRSYLSNKEFSGIDTLILGCTHYPIIKNQIREFFNYSANIIDSAEIVAKSLKKELTEKGMLNTDTKGEHEFFVSDLTDNFEKIAKLFFGQKINLTEMKI